MLNVSKDREGWLSCTYKVQSASLCGSLTKQLVPPGQLMYIFLGFVKIELDECLLRAMDMRFLSNLIPICFLDSTALEMLSLSENEFPVAAECT